MMIEERIHRILFLFLIFLLPVQLGRHFWPEFSFVLGLRVDYLAPTVYLTDILVVGILSLWIWEKRNQFSIFNFQLSTKKYWWIVSIFLFLLVNSLLAQNMGAALYKFVKIIEFTFLGFYIAKNQYSISTIQYPLIGAVVYSVVIALAQFFKQASLGGVFWWLGERTFTSVTPGIAKAVISGRLLMRPYATFPHPNVLAGFLLIAVILLFGSLKSASWQISKVKNKWLINTYWILTFSLTLTGLILSFSRSVWFVGLLVGLSVLGFGLWTQKRKLLSLTLSILFLTLIIAVLYFAPQFSTEEAINQRLRLIRVALQMIQGAPLTGVGLNNFVVRLPEFWTVQSIYWLQPVHNIFLLIAAETGFVGLMIFVWFLILTYKKLLVTNHWLLATALSTILTLGLSDHYWLTLQQSQLLLTVILGLSWAKTK